MTRGLSIERARKRLGQIERQIDENVAKRAKVADQIAASHISPGSLTPRRLAQLRTRRAALDRELSELVGAISLLRSEIARRRADR